MITRMIASSYTSFTEETIITRSNQMIELLNEYTNY